MFSSPTEPILSSQLSFFGRAFFVRLLPGALIP